MVIVIGIGLLVLVVWLTTLVPPVVAGVIGAVLVGGAAAYMWHDEPTHGRRPVARAVLAPAVIAAAVAAGLSGLFGGTSHTPSASAPPTIASDSGADASAKLACTHFRNVLADLADGVLTDAETRTKAKEIDSNASVSDWPGLATASRTFVSATTTGTGSDVVSAASRLADVCAAVPAL